MPNWFIKWENTNRIKPECAELIAVHGWRAYGIYTAVREIISQHGGSAPVQVIKQQLNLSDADIEPLHSGNNKCYFLLSGLLSDTELKNESDRQKSISEKRAIAGQKAMQKRWGKPAKPARGNGSKPAKKVSKNPDELDFEDVPPDEKPPITNVTSKKLDNNESKDSLTNTRKNEIITNVIQAAKPFYDNWFKTDTGVFPQESAAANKAIRSIVRYLLDQIIKSDKKHPPELYEAKTLESFQYLFKNFKFWGKYESSKIRLQDINSNLTNIIKNIRTHGKTNGNHQGGRTNGSAIAESLSNIDRAQL